MYIPRQFALSDQETEAAFAHGGFAHLVTHDPSGLMVTPLPLLYDQARHSLIGHVSRANPHWHSDGGESVAIFSGPQAYISPGFYATKAETGKVVPTWNYATVHAWGRPRIMRDETWLRQQLEDLTASRESSRAEPWKVDDAPAEFVGMQMRAIVGVEIPIRRIEGKWKMSQNRPLADREGVIAGFKEAGEAGEVLATLVEARGENLK